MRSAKALLFITVILTLAGCPKRGAVKSRFLSGSGAPVSNFTLSNIEGRQVSLRDYRGKKVVLINFWATWCQPCLVELPHLDRLQKKYASQGLVVLAINEDGSKTLSQVRTYINRYGYTFQTLLDRDGQVSRIFNSTGEQPFSLLIDRLGRIRMIHEGYSPGDEKALARKIDLVLKEETK